MKNMTIGEIVAATKGTLICGDVGLEICGVSTDTRALQKGELFVALAGEKFDGHTFLQDAIGKGAGALLVSHGFEQDFQVPVICVKDTLEALGDLAMYYRSTFLGRVVAVTGSTGKTSVKDMIAALLMQKYSVRKTFGNFNNEVGLPFTILGLESHHNFAVVEMGMRGLAQIARLSDIARPDVGVVTNVNETHIELLGTKEKIAEAKSELVSSLPSTGLAVLNRDDALVWGMCDMAKCPVRSFGFSNEANVRAGEVRVVGGRGTEFNLVTPTFNGTVFLSVPGRHNVMNALAAICSVLDFGINLDDINLAFSKLNLTEGRVRIQVLSSGVTVIDDTYNASPVSTKAALRLFNDIQDSGSSGRRVAVLGDMLELGDYAEAGHVDVGKACVGVGVDLLVIVGNLSQHIREGAILEGFDESKTIQFQDAAEAADAITTIVKPGDIVLIKGSRGMRMEKVVKALQKELSE
jgi:UDP-N-acetylmuramoyl-tripeptide--D-alanyl-D-alanine ligase